MVENKVETRAKSKYTIKDKLKAIGHGAMITASFIGPGTVTTCIRTGHLMDMLYCGLLYFQQ